MEDSTPFRYIGGDPALDLVNTVDWTSEGPRRDRLVSYDRLVTWAEGAGVVASDVAENLRRIARGDSQGAAKALSRARSARRILRDVFYEFALGNDATGALEALNPLLTIALSRLRVEQSGALAAYSWHEWGENPSCVLWPVVFSGANLLTSAEATHVGMCSGEDCGWMFVDRSRNRLRRWCEMETCGTIAKNQRRRARQSS
jgi:predicted RNA-binding Zn ribbon-like protein